MAASAPGGDRAPRLPPERRLPTEVELAEYGSLSRTTVREVARLLQQRPAGLVVS